MDFDLQAIVPILKKARKLECVYLFFNVHTHTHAKIHKDVLYTYTHTQAILLKNKHIFLVHLLICNSCIQNRS